MLVCLCFYVAFNTSTSENPDEYAPCWNITQRLDCLPANGAIGRVVMV